MQREETPRRRTTAAVLKQQAMAFLEEALPQGWISQPLAPGVACRGADVGQAPRQAGRMPCPSADILVISPRGRCHFLLVRAPADRWWDGGPRSVPAEKVGEREAEMLRQLRGAGHKARAIWGEQDLLRALRTWGCPLAQRVRFARGTPSAKPRPALPSQDRPVLHLGIGRGSSDA